MMTAGPSMPSQAWTMSAMKTSSPIPPLTRFPSSTSSLKGFFSMIRQKEAQNSHVYWWRYCIRLENLDSDVVQLRERHWRIFSLSGTLETVRGRGVVGREPVLSKEQPAFQYSSHVSLQASSGHMWGTFRFERPDGSHFDVRIPPFSLESNKDEKTPPSGLHW
uniref:DNA polymerase delta interacting protein 2 n=1 Tax=Pipistrellus kuhlii TaxID=59472 RepID=A0A7J7SMN8_PIPKU|nr:DNA polymerase delta interacting protein 2 [Pipistrellus kuhlii]